MHSRLSRAARALASRTTVGHSSTLLSDRFSGRYPRWVDTRDPEGVADFCLGLGLDVDLVVNTLVTRCSLDPITARRIVVDVAQKQDGGSSR